MRAPGASPAAEFFRDHKEAMAPEKAARQHVHEPLGEEPTPCSASRTIAARGAHQVQVWDAVREVLEEWTASS